MRVLLAGMLVVAMMAGCMAEPEDTNGDGELTLVADRKGVVFFQEEYEAIPDSPAEFQVTVDEGTINVTVEIRTVTAGNNPSPVAEVSLSGCGSATVDWGAEGTGNVAVQVGNSWRGAWLCDAATAGEQTLTITTDLQPLEGSVLLRGDIPSGCCYE